MLALPMAYALGSLLNFILIWVMFQKDFLNNKSSKISKTFIQSIIGAFVMGIVAYLALSLFDDVFVISTGLGIFLQGFFAGIIGISFGVLVLAWMRNQELIDIVDVLSHKFWRSRVLAPEQKEL